MAWYYFEDFFCKAYNFITNSYPLKSTKILPLLFDQRLSTIFQINLKV